MMTDLITIIQLTYKQQKKFLLWFSKQTIELRLEVLRNKKNEFFKIKHKYSTLSDIELDYISLLNSIKIVFDKLNNLNKKNKTQSLEEINDISKLELLSLKKSKAQEKRDSLINKLSVIKTLRENEKSWRDISIIFKRKYRLDVSHTYLKTIYDEFKNEQL